MVRAQLVQLPALAPRVRLVHVAYTLFVPSAALNIGANRALSDSIFTSPADERHGHVGNNAYNINYYSFNRYELLPISE